MAGHRWIMFGMAFAALLVAAARSTTTISDPCGGGLMPRADICAVTIAVDLVQADETAVEGEEELTLDSVTLEMHVDGSIEDRLPTDIWEVAWTFDGCLWGVRWFHDPGTDGPGELTTRLDRECEDGLTGLELDPPTVSGSQIISTVSAGELQQLDPTVAAGGVLERLGGRTYSGVGVQTDVYGYSQASYEHDDTERPDVPLTP